MNTRTPLVILLLVSAMIVAMPGATAHEDGCTLVAHQGPLHLHLACASNPETCLSNAKHSHIEANVACKDPQPVPCALKVQAVGHHLKACTNTLPQAPL